MLDDSPFAMSRRACPPASLPVWLTSEDIQKYQLFPPRDGNDIHVHAHVHGYISFGDTISCTIYAVPDPLRAFPTHGPLQRSLSTYSPFQDRTAKLLIRLLRTAFFDRVKYRRRRYTLPNNARQSKPKKKARTTKDVIPANNVQEIGD